MRSLFFASASLLLCSGFSFAADKPSWYAISNRTGKCVRTPGPTEMIRMQRQLKSPYTVVDEKLDNGKPVIVRIECPNDNYEFTYFRTKALCDSEALKTKAMDAAEMNRYK